MIHQLAKSTSIRGDIYGGITAAVVALPLALAFGVASGIGPLAGLYGAIAVGFFAAVFGGTPSQVSGPTGPMTVAMAVVVTEHAAGDLANAFAIVLLAGVFQLALGFLRVGRFIAYTPYSVVSGFMSGIGVIIILIQTLPFFGLPTAGGGPVGAIERWPQIANQFNWHALAVACISLAVIGYWPSRWRKVLPPALAALSIGTLLGLLVFVEAPIIGAIPTGLPSFQLSLSALENLPALLQPALILALLGAIDSLLTSLVADSLTRTQHNPNKELIGQGLGNIVASFIGGLPGAGATMRTVVNIRAGGNSPISGALHALILLLLVLGLGPFAEHIPHAVLAGILMKVGWDIIDWHYLKRATRAPRDKVCVMLATLLLTVFVDLITAVAVGLIIAGFVTASRRESYELDNVDIARAQQDAQIAIVRFKETLSFASARKLVKKLGEGIRDCRALVCDFSQLNHLDTSTAMALNEVLQAARENGIDCQIVGLAGEAQKTLDSLGVLHHINATQQSADVSSALQRLL